MVGKKSHKNYCHTGSRVNARSFGLLRWDNYYFCVSFSVCQSVMSVCPHYTSCFGLNQSRSHGDSVLYELNRKWLNIYSAIKSWIWVFGWLVKIVIRYSCSSSREFQKNDDSQLTKIVLDTRLLANHRFHVDTLRRGTYGPGGRMHYSPPICQFSEFRNTPCAVCVLWREKSRAGGGGRWNLLLLYGDCKRLTPCLTADAQCCIRQLAPIN